jgi:hypothetical protein
VCPGVPLRGGLAGEGGERIVEVFQLRSVGQAVGVLRQVVDEGLRPLRRDAGELGDALDGARLDDAVDAVPHADVALDGALDIGLGQSL